MNKDLVTQYNKQPGQWVALYNAQQDAYHVEPLHEYQDKLQNGYAILALCDTREEASAVASKARRGKK